MSDPTGRYEVKWASGKLTCSCRAFRYGDGPCKHIKWMEQNGQLPDKPSQKSLAEALLGDPEEQRDEAPREEMECFPMVDGLSVFPMKLSTFLRGLSRVEIDYRRGGLTPENYPTIRRIMTKGPKDGLVRVTWINEGGEGYTDLPEEGQIEHRHWRGGKTQKTVMGSGGQLWVDGDNVVFVTEDGRRLDESQWLDWLAGLGHQ